MGRGIEHTCIKKKMYSRYACIAFCKKKKKKKKWHASTEAKLILNDFQVYKTLIIQIKVVEKKKAILKTKVEC